MITKEELRKEINDLLGEKGGCKDSKTYFCLDCQRDITNEYMLHDSDHSIRENVTSVMVSTGLIVSRIVDFLESKGLLEFEGEKT